MRANPRGRPARIRGRSVSDGTLPRRPTFPAFFTTLHDHTPFSRLVGRRAGDEGRNPRRRARTSPRRERERPCAATPSHLPRALPPPSTTTLPSPASSGEGPGMRAATPGASYYRLTTRTPEVGNALPMGEHAAARARAGGARHRLPRPDQRPLQPRLDPVAARDRRLRHRQRHPLESRRHPPLDRTQADPNGITPAVSAHGLPRRVRAAHRHRLGLVRPHRLPGHQPHDAPRRRRRGHGRHLRLARHRQPRRLPRSALARPACLPAAGRRRHGGRGALAGRPRGYAALQPPRRVASLHRLIRDGQLHRPIPRRELALRQP